MSPDPLPEILPAVTVSCLRPDLEPQPRARLSNTVGKPNCSRFQFLKKTVIITGANRGTGRCVAENFIANGAEVFIHSLEEGDSLRTVKEIGFGEPLWGDISCDSGSERVFSQFKKKSHRLSILVNNLGSGSSGKWTDT